MHAKVWKESPNKNKKESWGALSLVRKKSATNKISFGNLKEEGKERVQMHGDPN
jgi:hypothetical protein